MNANIVAEAAGLFAATNVDDIVVLSLFFGRSEGQHSAGQPGAARRIVAGQYLGFTALLIIAVAAAYGATFLPESAIAYLGLLPLALGLRAAWQAWKDHRNGDRGEQRRDERSGVTALQVASVTFANGSDNIGVYMPVFARTGIAGIAVYVAVFLILVGVWCAAGRFFATRPAVAKVIGRWGHILHPLVLITLGLFILIQGGAFRLRAGPSRCWRGWARTRQERAARRSRTCNVRDPRYGDAMSNSDTPWEPPIAGTEAEQLLGALERQRATFRWKTDDLDEAQLNKRIGASDLTLASLLKHLAWVEASGFNKRLTGDPYGPPWDGVDFRADPDWEFRTAADDSPETLYALWDDAVGRSRERLAAFLAANGDLGQPVHLSWPDGTHASLRRLLFDLLEEYARHTGHADLLREAIDGRTGEDPPPGWRPVSGRFRFAAPAG